MNIWYGLSIDDIRKNLGRPMTIDSDQINAFMRLLRKNLIETGLDGSLFDKAVEISERELLIDPSENPVFSRAMDDSGSTQQSRGIDSLGRILVEFCFFRTPETPMIWPDSTEEDKTARKLFKPEILPRPLMRYFLASVRGSISKLDNFEATPIISDENDNSFDKVKINELLQEFIGPFGEGESAIDWQEVYEDIRFQKIAYNLINHIHRRIEELSSQHYLHIIEDCRQRDPDKDGINMMYRSFTLEDIHQIEAALSAAEAALAQNHIPNAMD